MNMINNPVWHEAMRRAQQARRLVRKAETRDSRLHLMGVSRFFLSKARQVRQRDGVSYAS